MSADLSDALRGVATGVLTPFDADGSIQFDALTDNVEALKAAGVESFLAPANVSEYHALATEERLAHAEATVEAVDGDGIVLSGVGGSLPAAEELIRGYERIGVDALMVMSPEHTFRHERGIITYHERVAESTSLPLVPYVRGYEPSLEHLVTLTELDGVVGIKYAVRDAHLLSQAVPAGRDEVVWIDGLAEPYAPEFFLAGAEGFSAGVSNFLPRIGLALFDALVAEEFDRAIALRDLSLPFMAFRAETGPNNQLAHANSIPALKLGLEEAGLHGGGLRPPLVPLSSEDRERGRELVDELKAGIDRFGL